jgi:hypothetical protein
MKRKIGTNKTFDCVAFKRQAQEDIYRIVRNMTPAQEIGYFAKCAREGKLGHWWKQVKAAGGTSTAPKRTRRGA